MRARPAARRDPTAAYLASFVSLGFMSNFLGPSLTALRLQVGVGVGTISWLFLTTSAGYFVGAVAAGRGYDRLLGHRLYASGIVVAAVCQAIVVWTSSFAILAIAFGAVGFALASIDVGGNTLLVWQRSGNVGPVMNALHLCFGVGALASPIVVNRSLAWWGNLRLAWCVIAVVCVITAVWIARSPSPAHIDTTPSVTGEVRAVADTRVLAVVAGFFVLYVGLEIGFASWIHTYAEVVHLGSANTISAVTTLFWVAFTLGRLTAVGVVHRLGSATLLRGASVLAVVGAAVLTASGGRSAGVWFATALFGMAVAPQFPTMIAFAEERLTLTGSAASWFLGAASVGGFAFPWLIGRLFDAVGAKAMPIVVLAASVATLLWLVIVERTLRSSSHRTDVGARPVPADVPS